MTPVTRLAAAIGLGALLASGQLLAAGLGSGTLTRAESLREKPFADARVLAPAAAGAKVDVLVREGGWYQVKAGTKTGWVRMLSVRRSTAATTTAAGIAGVASGRTGTGKVVSTTGVRGLDSAELATATFNEEQVAKAEKNRVNRKDAEAFAKAGKLTVRDVAPLPAPQ